MLIFCLYSKFTAKMNHITSKDYILTTEVFFGIMFVSYKFSFLV